MHSTKSLPTSSSGSARRSFSSKWTALGFLVILFLPVTLASAQSTSPSFSLPFTTPAGPSTWYVAQWYGSTVWAHRNWDNVYSQGQGIHFGIDFAAPCGTPVHAIGEGVVFAVDGPYGAAPHNVVIDHQDGLLSLYGHLRERSNLRIGQPVRQGDVIGVSGDPATPNCDQAAHLHLEIRRTGMRAAVNPVPLIAADWRSLTIGADTAGTDFVLFYDRSGTWMAIDQQPDTQFGGPIINQSGATWPPD